MSKIDLGRTRASIGQIEYVMPPPETLRPELKVWFALTALVMAGSFLALVSGMLEPARLGAGMFVIGGGQAPLMGAYRAVREGRFRWIWSTRTLGSLPMYRWGVVEREESPWKFWSVVGFGAFVGLGIVGLGVMMMAGMFGDMHVK